MKPSVQYVTAAVLLLAVTVLLQHSSRAEDTPDRTGFAAFPLELKSREAGRLWLGRDVALDSDVLAVLKVDDYMMRVYRPFVTQSLPVEARHASETERSTDSRPHENPKVKPAEQSVSSQVGSPMPAVGGVTAPVWLYTGYYQTQRSGVTYHSPLNCLPGSGWSILSREVVSVTVPDPSGRQERTELRVNKVLIQKGLETQLILYWYQDRGRTITSEYWAKAYLLVDAMTKNRTDGALVRISVPVASDSGAVADAFSLARVFLQDAFPRLLAHLPV